MMDSIAAGRVMDRAEHVVCVWSPWWSTYLGHVDYAWSTGEVPSITGLSSLVFRVDTDFLGSASIMDVAVALEFALQQAFRHMDDRVAQMMLDHPDADETLVGLAATLEITSDLALTFSELTQARWDALVNRSVDPRFVSHFDVSSPPSVTGLPRAEEYGYESGLRAEKYLRLLLESEEAREQQWLEEGAAAAERELEESAGQGSAGRDAGEGSEGEGSPGEDDQGDLGGDLEGDLGETSGGEVSDTSSSDPSGDTSGEDPSEAERMAPGEAGDSSGGADGASGECSNTSSTDQSAPEETSEGAGEGSEEDGPDGSGSNTSSTGGGDTNDTPGGVPGEDTEGTSGTGSAGSGDANTSSTGEAGGDTSETTTGDTGGDTSERAADGPGQTGGGQGTPGDQRGAQADTPGGIPGDAGGVGDAPGAEDQPGGPGDQPGDLGDDPSDTPGGIPGGEATTGEAGQSDANTSSTPRPGDHPGDHPGDRPGDTPAEATEQVTDQATTETAPSTPATDTDPSTLTTDGDAPDPTGAGQDESLDWLHGQAQGQRYVSLAEQIRHDLPDTLTTPPSRGPETLVGKTVEEMEDITAELAEAILNPPSIPHLPSASDTFSEWARTRLAPSTVSWKRILPGMLNVVMSRATMSGMTDLSYGKPNPNQPKDAPIMMGFITYPPEVTILIDVSPSMQQHVGKMMSEFIAAMKRFFLIYAQPVTVAVADGKVRWAQQSVTPYDAFSKQVTRTYHGTSHDFGETIKQVMKKGVKTSRQTFPKPDILVVLTDCEFEFPWADKRSTPRSLGDVIVVSVSPHERVEPILPAWIKPRKNFVATS